MKNKLGLLLMFVSLGLSSIAVAERQVEKQLVAGWDTFPETVVLNTEYSGVSDWEAYVQSAKGESLTEYVPKGQSLKHWHEHIGIAYLSYGHLEKATSLKSFVNVSLQDVLAACDKNGGKFRSKVLSKSKKDVTLVWSITDCGNGMKDDQTQVSRYMKGQYGFHTVKYAVKSPADTTHKIKQMEKTVASAALYHEKP